MHAHPRCKPGGAALHGPVDATSTVLSTMSVENRQARENQVGRGAVFTAGGICVSY
jgi:hypothetical protein